MPAPILVLSGPPAAGKSTVALALAAAVERLVIVPVDDVRLWVKAGCCDTLDGWTEETEAQFRLAEEAALDVAERYSDAGFWAVVDHCRNPARLESLVRERLSGRPHLLAALQPPLEVLIHRSRTRTNKHFDSAELEPVIESVHHAYANHPLAQGGWMSLDNVAPASETASRLAEAMRRLQ
ncbi:MAG: ATP-binding protein [Fimbriimonadaceae bacterium]|nr:ATP-binding protein [Fimbriimonadaceae bacterium]